MSRISVCKDIPRWIKEITGHLKAQDMCLEAVRIEPCSLVYVIDHFKTEEMCNNAVEKDPCSLGDVPVHHRTFKVCQKIVKMLSWCPNTRPR